MLILVHVQELVEQNVRALKMVGCSDEIVGMVCAGLNAAEWDKPIVVATIQSLYRHATKLGKRNLTIVDEAHRLPRSGEGMYQTLLKSLSGTYSDMRVAGFTATPFRLDTGRLDEGDNRLFDRIVFTYGIAQAIAEKRLAPFAGKAGRAEIDVTGVHTRGGEFVGGELEAAAEREGLVEAAVDEIIDRGRDRRSWIVFCCGVAHAAHVCRALSERGIICATVVGDTPLPDRRRIISEFRENRIRCLVGVDVLTTGFDAQAIAFGQKTQTAAKTIGYWKPSVGLTDSSRLMVQNIR